jgi:hypothetical protein
VVISPLVSKTSHAWTLAWTVLGLTNTKLILRAKSIVMLNRIANSSGPR